MKIIIASKLDVLRFIRLKQLIQVGDLVNEFGYSVKTARNKLYRLEKAKLVEKLGIRVGTYCLTNKATRRLEYHEYG